MLPNPFRTRHSERASRDLEVFGDTFGAEMLNVFPLSPFEHFYLIRSAPGAGKTSLMTVFTAAALAHVERNPQRLSTLYSHLVNVGALTSEGPVVVGALLNLQDSFLEVEDLRCDTDTKIRLFFRLLDARIMLAVTTAVLESVGAGAADNSSSRVVFRPREPRSIHALERLGRTSAEVMDKSLEAEGEILELFDQLVGTGQRLPAGHARLYSLQLLSSCDCLVDGEKLTAMPLLMLDDGHALSRVQRGALMKELADRSLTIGRWLALRSEALSDDELLGAAQTGRDVDIIELEAVTRERSSAGKDQRRLVGQTLNHRRYQKMLLDIADRRAQHVLSQIFVSPRSLSAMLEVEPEEGIEARIESALSEVVRRTTSRMANQVRYLEWCELLSSLEGRSGLARAAEIEVLVERDKKRQQGDLFEEIFPLTPDDVTQRGSSSLREAGLLRVSQEFNLPYYYGTEVFPRLGSANIEQWLELCGNSMSEVLRMDSLGRDISLPPTIQDRIARESSEAYYRDLVQFPDGYLVQRFVDRVAEISALEAKKPTVPYPPGVTGTALSMHEREILRTKDSDRRFPGSSGLRRALASAVANNVIWLELDYSNKNNRWMVMYLNRLLCPRFGMPLTLGGFREKRLSEMSGWFAAAQRPTQDSLMGGLF